jgi:hypothetical protein
MLLDGKFSVQAAGDDSSEEIAVVFTGGWLNIRRNILVFWDGVLEANNIRWVWKQANDWYIDFDALNEQIEIFRDLGWLKGVALVNPEVIEYPDSVRGGTRKCLEFRVYREEFVVNRNCKIFLSHKGVDKPRIRQYFRVLKTLGFDPWLDEDAMVAGTPLERGLLEGFEHSCAAVFFVTPSFQDENFLATEVNYAIAQKREKGDRFSIITIVFSNKKQKGKVPALLKSYVWKEPPSPLDALDEIVRALPLLPGAPGWKGHINPA